MGLGLNNDERRSVLSELDADVQQYAQRRFVNIIARWKHRPGYAALTGPDSQQLAVPDRQHGRNTVAERALEIKRSCRKLSFIQAVRRAAVERRLASMGSAGP